MRRERVWRKNIIQELWCGVSGHPKDLGNEKERMRDWLAQSAGLNLTNKSSVFLYVPRKTLRPPYHRIRKHLWAVQLVGGVSCTPYVSNHTLSPAALRNMFVVHSTLLNIILWPPSSHLSTVSIMLGLDSVAVCNIISA
jgi:hypothetical protein